MKLRPLFTFTLGLGTAGLLAAACGAQGSRTYGDPDDGDGGAAEAGPSEGGTSSPTPLIPDGGKAPDGAANQQCERELVMGKLSISNAACFVNEHVSNQTTKLQFPCAGGAATAVFQGRTFKGTVSGNTISLSNVEVFVFNSCNWQSTEIIKGDLATKTMSYSYTEKPVTTCPDNPCTAGGTVTVNAGEVVVVN